MLPNSQIWLHSRPIHYSRRPNLAAGGCSSPGCHPTLPFLPARNVSAIPATERALSSSKLDFIIQNKQPKHSTGIVDAQTWKKQFKSELITNPNTTSLNCLISMIVSCQIWLTVMHLLLKGIAPNNHKFLRLHLRPWTQNRGRYNWNMCAVCKL